MKFFFWKQIFVFFFCPSSIRELWLQSESSFTSPLRVRMGLYVMSCNILVKHYMFLFQLSVMCKYTTGRLRVRSTQTYINGGILVTGHIPKKNITINSGLHFQRASWALNKNTVPTREPRTNPVILQQLFSCDQPVFEKGHLQFFLGFPRCLLRYYLRTWRSFPLQSALLKSLFFQRMSQSIFTWTVKCKFPRNPTTGLLIIRTWTTPLSSRREEVQRYPNWNGTLRMNMIGGVRLDVRN